MMFLDGLLNTLKKSGKKQIRSNVDGVETIYKISPEGVISKNGKKIDESKYKVESSRKGKFYKVNIEQPFCNCPNFLFREIKIHGKCKHIKAVEEYLSKKTVNKTKSNKIIAYVKKTNKLIL